MIRSFAATETEQFYSTGKSRRFPPDIRKRAAMRLTQLDAATRIEDLCLPSSNRLEALAHDRGWIVEHPHQRPVADMLPF